MNFVVYLLIEFNCESQLTPNLELNLFALVVYIHKSKCSLRLTRQKLSLSFNITAVTFLADHLILAVAERCEH